MLSASAMSASASGRCSRCICRRSSVVSAPRCSSPAGSFYLQLPAPIEPATYAARITMPVLMINGRFDYLNTLESQARLFDLLGTPAAEKRRAVVDSGHLMPRAEVLRESLGWLDEQFGAVRPLRTDDR